MGTFNNREIATALWLIVFIAWAMGKVDIRKSLAGVVRAFFRFKILVFVCPMLLYVAVVVTLLATIGFWKIYLLKDTIVWFCVVAIAMVMRFVTSEDSEKILLKVLSDNIKIIIFIEFLVNTYTFSLPAELVILPVVALVAALDAVASAVSNKLVQLFCVLSFRA